MEQRLTRARSRLRNQGTFEMPRGRDAAARLDAVLRTLHLLFNEGYWSTDDVAPIRGDLCRLALGLARSLREASPGEPEVAGVLALFLLHEGRRPGRLDAGGAPIPVPEQDRTHWDRKLIDEGTAELEGALAAGKPGPFQTEAAISAVHCRARTAAETDWREIAALSALLEGMRPTPAIRVNRAFALSRVDGPAAGLALLDADCGPSTEAYGYARVVRGVLLAELGRRSEAIAELEIARAGARNAGEAPAIARRIEELR